MEKLKKKENVKNLIIALIFGIVAFIVLLAKIESSKEKKDE